MYRISNNNFGKYPGAARLWRMARPIVTWMVIALMHAPEDASAQLVLNEMMSANASTLRDQYGDYPDWLELHNASDTAVDLGGYWLSDELSSLKKWNFPDTELAPGGYTIVFASGRDHREKTVYWHTMIDAGHTWRYLLPQNYIGDGWKTSVAATSDWQTGKSGIGYGDNDDSTVVDQTLSVYMQTEFTINDPGSVTDAALFMDYDDGFVAYLNGEEIARSTSMGGSPGSTVAYNQTAEELHEALMYNGLPPEGHYLTDRINLLESGVNILAIEVHNYSEGSSDLTAMPFFVLGFSDLQGDLPRGNRFFVLADRYPHTNFRIKAEGEPVYLSDNLDNIADHLDVVYLPPDYSIGRHPDIPDSMSYFELPTPGKPNDTPPSSEFFSDSVRFVAEGSDFGSFRRVSMVAEEPGDTIYYTSDGSEPDRGSGIYSGEIFLDETTVLKARIFRSGSLPGPVTAKTFFIGEGHDLPVVSVSTDPHNLWDETEGIYVKGPNAQSQSPYKGANFWQDWERPVYIEVYDGSHQPVLAQHAGTKIFGAYSRAHEQKSMSFFARAKYGDGSFSARLFEEKPIDKFEAFIMRNSGNDWCNSFFRDAFIGQLARDMDLDYQAYQPYVFYLNGAYWGILNMREKINEHFLAGNHRIHDELVNLLERNAGLIEGEKGSYEKLLEYLTINDMSRQEHFEAADSMIDIRNFISYWVLNVYVNNKDWPGNNIKYWSAQAPGSKFRWIVYDTDFGLSIWDNQAYNINTLLFSLGEGDLHNWANPDWATFIVRRLLENEAFRIRFINEFADRMNSTFLFERTKAIIDSFEYRIDSEVPAHLDLFNAMSGNTWRTYDYWKGQVEHMRVFLQHRPEIMRQHIMDRFDISTTHSVQLEVSGNGRIQINRLIPERYPFDGIYFHEIPITLEAIPAPGYRFSHWTGTMESEDHEIEFLMSGDGTFTAVFEEAEGEEQVVINEINYFSSPEKNTGDWVELYNDSEFTVDLGGWILKDGFSHDTFRIPDGTVLLPGAFTVVCREIRDFRKFYPETGPLLGDMGYGLDREEDGLGLYTPDGALHDFVIYTSTAPWPEAPNGTGATLELIHPDLDNALPESWMASEAQGSPCEENSRYDPSAVGISDRPGKPLADVAVYPTLFHDKLFIDLTLEEEEEVCIRIYNLVGALIDVPVSRTLSPGNHRLEWDPAVPGSHGAVFLVSVQTGSSIRTFRAIRH